MKRQVTIAGNAVTIVSDCRARPLLSRFELPQEVMAREFDYIKDDDDSARFVKYRGQWVDVYESETLTIRHNGDLRSALADGKWQAFMSDSYFSGLLFRFDEDEDGVIVGRYYC